MAVKRAKYEVVEAKLGRSPVGWLREHRETDPPHSWRWLTIELARLTGVVVTDVTLAKWLEDAPTPATDEAGAGTNKEGSSGS